LSKKKNFDEVINGTKYLVNKEKNTKRIYTDNGRFLRSNEDKDSPVFEVSQPKKDIPTLDSIFGCVDRKGFLDILEGIYVNKLNFTKEQFWENCVKDPVILQPMYPQWRNTRDANWLYNEKNYAFETLHCNLFVTIKSSKNGGTDRFATIRNTLMHLDILDFDDKEHFTVLDLGSGMGLTTLMIAARFRNSTVFYNELNPSSKIVFEELLKIANSHCGLDNIVILEKEEVDEDLDVICAFEAVEHIPDQKEFGVGNPMPWVDLFLQRLKTGGYFLYETMWNAEFNPKTGDKVLGHFLEYKFDGVKHGIDKNKNGGRPLWGKYFQESLAKRDVLRVNGKTGRGYKDLKWAFRGGPKVYEKVSNSYYVSLSSDDASDE